MVLSAEVEFPKDFGNSPEDFLTRYERLIYKVIHEKTDEDGRFDAEELFISFFIHISENNFRRLHKFKKKSKPITYIGTILRNFICDQYRKEQTRKKVGHTSLEEIEEHGAVIAQHSPNPEDNLISLCEDEIISEAFEETFSQLSNRDKIVFDLTYGKSDPDEKMAAQDIADLLGIKVKQVYKTNERIKNILKRKLIERGIVQT